MDKLGLKEEDPATVLERSIAEVEAQAQVTMMGCNTGMR